MKINFLKADGNIGFDATVPLAAQSQLTAAAKVFTDAFVDPININIKVTFGSFTTAVGAPIPVGESHSAFDKTIAYSGTTDSGNPGILQRLIDDRTSSDDKIAIDNLPNTDSHTYRPTRAEEKALGIIASDSVADGDIKFNTAFNFDYTHSGTGGKLADPNAFDFFGIATHEISELMGRNSFIVPGGEFNTYVEPLDLFKRDASKALTFDGSKPSSFTIDGGTTTLLAFNNGTIAAPPGGFVTRKGDFSDWADSADPAHDDEAWRAFPVKGNVIGVSAADLRVTDVIGFDKKATDLVLAIDTTGSMGPYIANVKTNANKIISDAFGTASDPIDARIGIVGFKDAAGPNGPGENTAILKFTEQDTPDARKTAAVNAINSISVGGGGDIPEGDNSAVLFALRDQGLSSTNPLPAGKPAEYSFAGNFRKSAQSHRIIVFSDAPIKDTGLAGDVTDAVNKLPNTTKEMPGVGSAVASLAAAEGLTVVDSSGIGAVGPVSFGDFTFADNSGAGEANPGPDVPGTASSTVFKAQVFSIQVGSDPDATATLKALAESNNGAFFTGDATNLADLIASIINRPPDLTLVGTDGDDTLDGGEGNDNLDGLGGNDTLNGNGGNDQLFGRTGNDVLNGGDGNDFLDGGPGADTIDGGPGFDLASWLGETSGLTLNLGNQSLNAGSAAGDMVSNVEAFYLTNSADSFTAGATGIFLYGFDGNDTIVGSDVSDVIDGGPGADTIDARGGFDYISYYSSANPVTVDLKNPANNTGDAAGDTITNAEAYILTSKDDTFVGSDTVQNIVFGYEGNDTMIGGFNTNNYFIGGDGDNRMVGGGVRDLFVGGSGVDTIVPVTPTPIAGSSVFNFTAGQDKLEISRAAFGLSPGYAVNDGTTLVSGTGPVATTTDPTFFYYTDSGLFYFDPDGAGATAANLLMQFAANPAGGGPGAPPALTAGDFKLI